MTRTVTTPPPAAAARDRLLPVAITLFAQCGYNGISTREIAASAGVSEITIYRHYPNKRDLYRAAIESELQRLYLRGDMFTYIAESPDWRAALARTYELISTTISSRPELVRLIQFGVLEMHGDIEPLLRRYLGQLVEILASYVEPWLVRGDLTERNPKAVVLAFASIVFSYPAVQTVFGSDTPRPDKLVEVYIANLQR